MEFFKKVWDKFKQPKMLWLVLFYIAFLLVVTGTILLVVFVPNQTAFHFILYFLSAISLTYFIYTVVVIAPKMKAGIIRYLKKYKLTRILLSNYGYRTVLFSFLSFILNVAYVVFIGVFGILSRSAWYISITSYYLILSLTKGSVIYNRKKNNTKTKQAKVYRYCGTMFIILTVVLAGILVLIYTANMSFKYAGIMLYAVAIYTFYYLVLAIYNFFKVRKYNDLFLEGIRNINLIKSLVSLLVLQVAMINAFSPENQTSIANAITGFIISILILFIGIFMILKANKILLYKKSLQINNVVIAEKEIETTNQKYKDQIEKTDEGQTIKDKNRILNTEEVIEYKKNFLKQKNGKKTDF